MKHALPFSAFAEHCMIGAMMRPDLAKIPVVLPEPRDYHQEFSRRLAEVCFALMRADKPVDLVNVMSSLKPGELEKLNQQLEHLADPDKHYTSLEAGEKYTNLTHWLADAIGVANVTKVESLQKTAQLIKDHAQRRTIMLCCMETYDEVATAPDVDAVRVGLRNALDDMGTDTAVEANLVESLAKIIRKSDEPLPEPKVKTFFDLDQTLHGLDSGELVVLAARPGMGKTAFACQLILNAIDRGNSVDFWSLEMPSEQILKRMLLNRIEASAITRQNVQAVIDASEALIKLKLRIFDVATPSMPMIENATRIRRPDLVVIDYLQLLPGDRRLDRHLQVAELSKGLKAISRRFESPVLCLAQLNREVEKRANKRPMLSDLRESGAIEQDADKIMFLYRESYYSDKSAVRGADGVTEVIVEKHRNGPVGTCELIYKPSQHRFEMITSRTQPAQELLPV